MAESLEFLGLTIVLLFSIELYALAEGDNQFVYNGFHEANLHLEGAAQIHPSGLLQLTNTTKEQTGHAFYQVPLNLNRSSSGLVHPLSLSTNFVFAIVPDIPNYGGHGLAFIISPSMNFERAAAAAFLGIFNASNNGNSSNHVVAVEFDTEQSPQFGDIDDNHVGIDVNSVRSMVSTPVSYFSNEEGINKSFGLISGKAIEVWIEYDEVQKLLNVTAAPIESPKPNKPLLSTSIDLSHILLDSVFVGFSASTGAIGCNHYILGWSFNQSGQAQGLDVSMLPSFPHPRKQRKIFDLAITVSAIAMSIVLITVTGAAYVIRRRKFEEIREDWEQEYGPQRFSYKRLHRATKGFRDSELLGAGGFGRVYRGVIPSSNTEVAVKRISHDSAQGMKEFVAEIASMGRIRHRNLVALLGYCRRKGELILVYDYMPNGSLDKFLFGEEKPNLSWAQRYRILRGIATGLQYLHEEWEQVILHRDVKASNVLLDADLNGRLGDFGLARLHDHGANPQTTHVVGTVGYLAPELVRTSKATTSTDVFAFGAFLLEVACGRRPVEQRAQAEDMVLIDWVFESWKRGAILETSDPRLKGEYLVEEMELVLKLGLLCSHSNPLARPSMRQVTQYLDGDAILPELHPDSNAGLLMVGQGNEVSADVAMSFPSSCGMTSAISVSSTDSVLHIGR